MFFALEEILIDKSHKERRSCSCSCQQSLGEVFQETLKLRFAMSGRGEEETQRNRNGKVSR
jgi:hypothetical protein